MREELELQLEKDFAFMKRNKGSSDEPNIYRKWGCECSNGWYQLIHDLCQAIVDRYEKDDRPVDIVIMQVKEKFAGLRFYYAFEDAPCPIQAVDSFGLEGIRFRPKGKDGDDDTRKLREDISRIVQEFEEKSRTVCEICGEEGSIRMDMLWKKTLCDKCYENYLAKAEASKKARIIGREKL